MARVELKGVSKRWDTATAVEQIDLTLEDGAFAAILGPSGCGKSTTLLMLAGIYTPTDGDILFDGRAVNDVEARDRNVGIVFQSYALYPNMTVLQNIMFPLRFTDTPKAEARARAEEVAALVQVGELLSRRPSELSGGQQQRVALARALVKRPNLLLLDEPLSNLDAALRMTMRAELKRLTRELGVTTVLVTHDQLEATTMADRVICMNKGRIEQAGSAEDLYARPETLFVAGFIGAPPMNLLKADVQGGVARVGEAALRVSAETSDGPATFGVRPEHVRGGLGGVSAKITFVEPMGRETLYLAETPAGPLRFLEATAQPRWAEGDATTLAFDASDTLVFDAGGARIDGARAELAPPAAA